MLKSILRAVLILVVPLGAIAAGPGTPIASANPSTSGPKGSLVIIGGNLRPDNADVWLRIVQLAGGAGARIAVLPSASGDPVLVGQATVTRLKEYGADAFLVPLAVKLADSDFRKVENTVLGA
jgi:cyanophycinase